MFTKKIILVLFLSLTLFVVGCDRGEDEDNGNDTGNSSSENMVNISTPSQQVVSSQAQQLFVNNKPVIEFRVQNTGHALHSLTVTVQARFRGGVVDTATGVITFPTNTVTAELATDAIATVRATFSQLESHLDYDEAPLVTFTYTIQKQENGSL